MEHSSYETVCQSTLAISLSGTIQGCWIRLGRRQFQHTRQVKYWACAVQMPVAWSVISYRAHKYDDLNTYPQGLDLCHVKVTVQYRLPKNLNAVVQHFGRAGRDPSIQATGILLVEKTYFSKSELERWGSRLEDIPSMNPSKRKSSDTTILSPRKRTILGE